MSSSVSCFFIQHCIVKIIICVEVPNHSSFIIARICLQVELLFLQGIHNFNFVRQCQIIPQIFLYPFVFSQIVEKISHSSSSFLTLMLYDYLFQSNDCEMESYNFNFNFLTCNEVQLFPIDYFFVWQQASIISAYSLNTNLFFQLYVLKISSASLSFLSL